MNSRRSRSTLPRAATIGIWAVGALVCVAIGLSARGVPLLGNPDKAAVRHWLTENLPSGKWEEIQWWDTIDHGGHRLTRLKYRTENPFGGMSVLEEVFDVTDAANVQNLGRYAPATFE